MHTRKWKQLMFASNPKRIKWEEVTFKISEYQAICNIVVLCWDLYVWSWEEGLTIEYDLIHRRCLVCSISGLDHKNSLHNIAKRFCKLQDIEQTKNRGVCNRNIVSQNSLVTLHKISQLWLEVCFHWQILFSGKRSSCHFPTVLLLYWGWPVRS